MMMRYDGQEGMTCTCVHVGQIESYGLNHMEWGGQ
jgi:hypothetical protein